MRIRPASTQVFTGRIRSSGQLVGFDILSRKYPFVGMNQLNSVCSPCGKLIQHLFLKYETLKLVQDDTLI